MMECFFWIFLVTIIVDISLVSSSTTGLSSATTTELITTTFNITDPCLDVKCKYGGCISRPDGTFICVCFNGFGGLECEQIHGGWGAWGPWEPKSCIDCGIGRQFRKRGCTRPRPENGGKNCSGIWQQSRACRAYRCPDKYSPELSKAFECVQTTEGTTYVGAKQVTEEGWPCMSWHSGLPGFNLEQALEYYPDDMRHNFCRNGRKGKYHKKRPWCFTERIWELGYIDDSVWSYCEQMVKCYNPSDDIGFGSPKRKPNTTLFRRASFMYKYIENYHCYTEKGNKYYGPVSMSESGKDCLHWYNTDIPLEIGYHQALVNNLLVLEDSAVHNHCRNPFGFMDKPYCYVGVEPIAVSEYCNISHCTELEKDYQESLEAHDCIEDNGDYFGPRMITENDSLCIPWDETELLIEPNLKEDIVNDLINTNSFNHGFCRNPARSKERPWCFVMYGGEWEYCDIRPCKLNGTEYNNTTTPKM